MKTKYSELIEIRESAIAFKIQPENGDWRDFIPNEQFNDVLRKVVNSVYNNNTDFHKPFWIAGTYGSGKSHAGAVIKHLLCDEVAMKWRIFASMWNSNIRMMHLLFFVLIF